MGWKMTCDKLHTTDADFRRLVREREEALTEVQVFGAENERLRHELATLKANYEAEITRLQKVLLIQGPNNPNPMRNEALEEAARYVENRFAIKVHGIPVVCSTDLAAELRALKGELRALKGKP